MLIWIFFLVNIKCLFTTVCITLNSTNAKLLAAVSLFCASAHAVPSAWMPFSSSVTLSSGSLLLILKIQPRPITCREFFLITFRLSQFPKNCHWFRMDIRPMLAQSYKGRTFSSWQLFSLVLSCWGSVREAGHLISSDSLSLRMEVSPGWNSIISARAETEGTWAIDDLVNF